MTGSVPILVIKIEIGWNKNYFLRQPFLSLQTLFIEILIRKVKRWIYDKFYY